MSPNPKRPWMKGLDLCLSQEMPAEFAEQFNSPLQEQNKQKTRATKQTTDTSNSNQPFPPCATWWSDSDLSTLCGPSVSSFQNGSFAVQVLKLGFANRSDGSPILRWNFSGSCFRQPFSEPETQALRKICEVRLLENLYLPHPRDLTPTYFNLFDGPSHETCNEMLKDFINELKCIN